MADSAQWVNFPRACLYHVGKGLKLGNLSIKDLLSSYH